MNKLLYAAFAFLCLLLPASAQTHRYQVDTIAAIQSGLATLPTTYYVRKDGGNRQQCDGKADVAYPGGIAIQHCALNDFRFLYQDGTYGNNKWIISGGDMVIIRGGPWRSGWNNASSALDLATGFYFGQPGDPYNSEGPPIPSGTAAAPTRILGENFASCPTSDKATEVFGGFGSYAVLNTLGSQYVTVECLKLDRHSQCSQRVASAAAPACKTSAPLDDYASNGILENNQTSNLTLQDMWIQSFTKNGVLGAIGGTVTSTNVHILYNGVAGWEFDDGSGQAFGAAAKFIFLNSEIGWSGCIPAYPATSLAIQAIGCWGEAAGGYGDAIGTPANSSLAIVDVENSSFHHNTQDGADFLHDQATGTPVGTSFTLKNNTFEANVGQGIKWGESFATVNVTGNNINTNCGRWMYPFASSAAGFSHVASADSCRGKSTITYHLGTNTVVNISNNNIVTTQPTIIDEECDSPVTNCSKSKVTFDNNIVIAYNDPLADTYGGNTGPGFLYIQGPVPGTGFTEQKNNIFYQIGHGFTCGSLDFCVSPQFVGQPTGQAGSFVGTQLDNFNYALVPTSPAIAKQIGSSFVGNTPPPVVVTPPPPPVVKTPTTPAITWNTPGSVVAGTALGAAQLNATASTAGSFAYSPAAGTVLTAGTVTLSTTFTPTDQVNFTRATKSVQIVVTAPVVVVPPNPLPMSCNLAAKVTISATGQVTISQPTCN
jgi:hypothetical protein